MNYEIKNIISLLENLLQNNEYASYAQNIQIAIENLSNIDITPPVISSQTQEENFEYKEFAHSLSITGYYGFEETVKIPDMYHDKKITRISGEAFHDCLNMKNLILGKYVDVIEHDAFRDCINLETVKIQSQLLFIGEGAFCNCTKLQHINLPNTIHFIGDSAFCKTAISTISIPTNLAFLSEMLFYGCKNLKHVSLHNNIVAIGKSAFSACVSLNEIVLPPSVAVIYEGAFYDCTSLEKVTIFNPQVEIAWDAFDAQELEDDCNEDIIWPTPTLPNLTIYCLPKSTTQKYCRDRLIKTQKAEETTFSAPLSPSRLTDVIGFTFPKNKKKIDIIDTMYKYNLVVFEKHGGEFIFTSNSIEEPIAKPYKIKDYLENKRTKYY